MLAIRFRWKGKCPKHPYYNPEKHGEGGIKGCCATCSVLFRVHQARHLLAQSARCFDEIASSGESLPAIRRALEVIRPTGDGKAPCETAVAAEGETRSRLRSAP